MRIVDVEQNSPEWFAARRGLPTASCFDQIVTAQRGDLAAAHERYINQLIDELVRPDSAPSFTGNRHTERGKLLEPEARRAYAFVSGHAVQTVGLVLRDDGRVGCSPDALVPDLLGWSHGVEV
jgi:hypothetical protein